MLSLFVEPLTINTMSKRNWFSVDTDGLAQLQAGKPKWHVVRELVQNAFDEEVSSVSVDLRRNGRTTFLVVTDSGHVPCS